jgi:hypothetical protein
LFIIGSFQSFIKSQWGVPIAGDLETRRMPLDEKALIEAAACKGKFKYYSIDGALIMAIMEKPLAKPTNISDYFMLLIFYFKVILRFYTIHQNSLLINTLIL